MTTPLHILKSILLPVLEKDSLFNIEHITTAFWERTVNAFLNYNENNTSIQDCINRLELATPEKVISKLPELHELFISQLAEAYVLGEENDITQELLDSNHQAFIEDVAFLTAMSQAIKKVERQRLKDSFSEASPQFDISDTTIALATKKKGREDLRAQFKEWDADLNKEHDKKGSKVISLSWIRYAVAALLLVSVGLFTIDSDMFNSSSIEIVALEETTSSISILADEGLGYTNTSTQKTISFRIINPKKRLASLEKAILEDTSYKEEFDALKNKELHYLLKDDLLTIYFNEANPKTRLLKTESEQLYLLLNDSYYIIETQDELHPLVKETDQDIIDQLDKIIFEHD